MKKLIALAVCLSLAASTGMVAGVALPSAVHAQGNDNDYTPLNSRIRRDRQFPLEPQNFMEPRDLSRVERSRSRSMVARFGRCMWDRSNEDSLAFLARTDFGFVNFEQIGMTREDVDDNFPIGTCLDRVASHNRSGVVLNYTDAGIRQWLLEQAYLDAYQDGPTWLIPGNVVGDRSYPVSSMYPAVHSAMDFADCVVASDPVGTDYFFRTGEGSDEETSALRAIVPAITPCIPEGQQMEIDPFAMRVWIGEALWHAANNNAPAPAEDPQEEQ